MRFSIVRSLAGLSKFSWNVEFLLGNGMLGWGHFIEFPTQHNCIRFPFVVPDATPAGVVASLFKADWREHNDVIKGSHLLVSVKGWLKLCPSGTRADNNGQSTQSVPRAGPAGERKGKSAGQGKGTWTWILPRPGLLESESRFINIFPAFLCLNIYHSSGVTNSLALNNILKPTPPSLLK